MGYYGLLVPAFVGHLNPLTLLGRALKERGHRVAFLSPLDAAAKVRGAGMDFIPIAQAEFPEGEWDRTTAEMGQLSGWKASRFAGKWMGRFVRGILRDLPVVAAQEKFDGLVMDQVAMGAEAVCERTRLPLAVACAALVLHVESGIPPVAFSWPFRTAWPFRLRNLAGQLLLNSTGWPVIRELVPYRFRHRLGGMRFDHIGQLPPSLVQVAQLPALLDFPRRRLPDHFYYTGPWVEHRDFAGGGFPWEQLDGRALVYASLGTLQNRLFYVFQMIAEACANLDVQLVIALGRKGASLTEPLPGAPLVLGYAPQQALLKRASLVITHGGLNTSLESLSQGVPLIALPITNDQPGVAARLDRLGVARFIPVQQLSVAKLRDAVQTVLRTPAYRERAGKVAGDSQMSPGADRAAELIELAFTRRERVVRSRPGKLASVD